MFRPLTPLRKRVRFSGQGGSHIELASAFVQNIGLVGKVRTKRPVNLQPLPVDVVTQEQVVLRWWATKLIKNADEVAKISMQVTDDDCFPTDTQQARLP